MSDKFSSAPACDGKKLLIEVTGIQHGAEQDFEFYDLTDMTQQPSLEAKKKIDPELDDTTVYSWDWSDEKENRNVWLKVDADGGPIKLPLFENVTVTERKQDEQDYLVHSVLPLTLLPSYQGSVTNADRVAPVRAGYLYVFYNHKAWREIHITPEDGEMCLKDVHLYRYREGRDQPFKDEERVATGMPLSEIWIPAKAKNEQSVVHIAFSEVQWSAPRLNYLEAHPEHLMQRAKPLDSLNAVDGSDILKITALPAMRMRAPELEFFLAEPMQLNRDLSGAWVKQTYQTVKGELESMREDGASAPNMLRYYDHQPHRYEYGLRHSALMDILSPDAEESEMWEAETTDDYLAQAKQGHLRAIVLDDPLFDLRHHTYLARSGVAYMQQIYVDMSQQPHYRSAELVQKLVVPPKFGENENPSHAAYDEMDTFLGGRFHRTLRTVERQICCTDIENLQGYVQSIIEEPRLAEVIRDISSLNDINAAAAHKLIGEAASALCANTKKLDQLSHCDSRRMSPYFDTAKAILLPNSGSALHSILFPAEQSVSLDECLEQPPEAANLGDGLATPESLALWFKKGQDIQDEDLRIFDLAFMSSANNNEEGAFGPVRQVANTLDGILRGYYEILLELSQDLADEAKVIEFNSAYAPVLRLMKAANSEVWGDITYQPVGGKAFRGTVVGVEGHGLTWGLSNTDREHIKTKQKNAPMARMYENASGKLVASTGKNAFRPSDIPGVDRAAVGPKLPLKVVVVSEDSHVAEAFNQANTRRALNNVNQTASNAYEGLRVPYFIAVIELVNLMVNTQHFSNLARSKDSVYSGAQVISVAADLGIATVHASNLYTQNASRLATVSNAKAFNVPNSLVDWVSSKSNTVRLVGKVSAIGLASLAAGFLTAAIAGWDAIRLWQSNDIDASIAKGMVATGALVTTVATGLFTTSAPILFGMGPVAWLGIGLSVVGLVLYSFWKNTPLEDWMTHGPFAKEPNEDYQHLLDPKSAYEHLVGLFLKISTKGYHLESQTAFSEQLKRRMRALGATHIIHVNTNLASLLNPTSLDTDFYARQAIERKTVKISRVGRQEEREIINISSANSTLLKQEKTDEGYAFFIKYEKHVPKTNMESRLLSGRVYEHHYSPALITRAQLKVEEAIFPTLTMEQLEEGKVRTPVPSFNLDDDSDLGWAKDSLIINTRG
ncbi:toxin VasX [Salinivibrio sp. MA607]|uniref:toxin VasX n=1 Tax=Salinivibrio sp. MA607 TaxID=1909457 RepID=UPI0009893B35|nr:toxin VasX [Salinivibrio sp. MA607]OOF02434.1 hypothetical protein BZG81_14370 [Salinivibrio sp. MA607]